MYFFLFSYMIFVHVEHVRGVYMIQVVIVYIYKFFFVSFILSFSKHTQVVYMAMK